MEDSRENSQKAYEVAVRKLRQGDVEGARRFAKKSLAIHSNTAAAELLQTLETGGTASSSTATGTDSKGGADMRARKPDAAAAEPPSRPSKAKSFTAEQKLLVEKIVKRGRTKYYEILEVEKTATDHEIKRSYRKLALQLHPDKNSAPGADEAFKMVSKSFQVLSDPTKRAAFDQYGADPDSNASRMNASSPFGRTSAFRSPYGGGMQEEVSPEDLFNMFFGGGGGGAGGAFGGSPFMASFGGPGVRVHQFGGGPRARARRSAGAGDARDGGESRGSNLIQIAPLLLLLLVTLLSSLFSSDDGGSNGGSSGGGIFASSPSFRFTSSAPFTEERITGNYKVPYFVNPRQTAKLSQNKLRQLERRVEVRHVQDMSERCELEWERKQRQVNSAYGWLGSVDREALQKAEEMEMPSCERLKAMGYRSHG